MADSSTFRKNGKTYTTQSGLTQSDSDGIIEIHDHTEEVLSGMNRAWSKALETIGLLAEGYAKRLCPVDTGRLRNSITHDVDSGLNVYIGTNVEYGKYVEYGTSKRKAKPYLRPAAQNHIDEYMQVIQECMEEESG